MDELSHDPLHAAARPLALRAATTDHLLIMMDWFPDRRSCRVWGGPEFRYPFTAHTFREDSRFEVLPSYVAAENQALIGFGQYYLRAGRCHLSRVAVAPALRGAGWGSRLLSALIDLGTAALGVAQCSLFVSVDNPRAAHLYRRLGFEEVAYPGPEPGVRGILYLVAEIRRLRSRATTLHGSAP